MPSFPFFSTYHYQTHLLVHFIYCLFAPLKCNSDEGRDYFQSFLFATIPLAPKQCLAYSWWSINICWMNTWIHTGPSWTSLTYLYRMVRKKLVVSNWLIGSEQLPINMLHVYQTQFLEWNCICYTVNWMKLFKYEEYTGILTPISDYS